MDREGDISVLTLALVCPVVSFANLLCTMQFPLIDGNTVTPWHLHQLDWFGHMHDAFFGRLGIKSELRTNWITNRKMHCDQ